MSSLLSNLVDNLSEGIHNNKCLDCNSSLDYVRITKNEKLLLINALIAIIIIKRNLIES